MESSDPPSVGSHHLSVLTELVAKGARLLDDDSRVVQTLAFAVKVDRIVLQFELLGDEIYKALLFLEVDKRSGQWLERLLRDLEDVLDMFRWLGPDAEVHADK